jgi:hypothetical protein
LWNWSSCAAGNFGLFRGTTARLLPCILHSLSGSLQLSTEGAPPVPFVEVNAYLEFIGFAPHGTALATWSLSNETRDQPMNLAIWLPALFALGLATMGLMFAFLAGCARI